MSTCVLIVFSVFQESLESFFLHCCAWGSWLGGTWRGTRATTGHTRQMEQTWRRTRIGQSSTPPPARKWRKTPKCTSERDWSDETSQAEHHHTYARTHAFCQPFVSSRQPTLLHQVLRFVRTNSERRLIHVVFEIRCLQGNCRSLVISAATLRRQVSGAVRTNPTSLQSSESETKKNNLGLGYAFFLSLYIRNSEQWPYVRSKWPSELRKLILTSEFMFTKINNTSGREERRLTCRVTILRAQSCFSSRPLRSVTLVTSRRSGLAVHLERPRAVLLSAAATTKEAQHREVLELHRII